MVITDAAQVRRAYLDALVKSGEESPPLDFLLRTDGTHPAETSFAAALKLQSREYDAVEALLRCAGALS